MILNQERSWLSIVIPERSVNLVFDPETLAYANGHATFQTISSTFSVDEYVQKRGLSSIWVHSLASINGGIGYLPPQGVSAGLPYSFSVDCKGGQGLGFALKIERQSDALLLASQYFEGTSFWQRPSLTFVPSASTLVRISVRVTSDTTDGRYDEGFWVDGWQFEQKPYATTFFSGDNTGFFGERQSAYGWTGSPHNSPSYRLESTRSGGRVRLLSELGLFTTELSGLGLVDPDNQIDDFASDHGGVFSHTLLKVREWTASGFVCAVDGIVDLHGTRQNLIHAVSPLLGNQPVRFFYQPFDCQRPLADSVVIDSIYSGGLDLKINNYFTEDLDIDFVSPDPFVYDSGHAAMPLEMNDGTMPGGVTAGLPARGETNFWEITATVPTSPIHDLELGPDGYMYCIGGFHIYRWNGYVWTGILETTGQAFCLASTPDNYLYIVGNFSAFVGHAGAFTKVARYNVATGVLDNVSASDVSGGPINDIYTAIYHPSGKLLIGGNFHSAGNSLGTVVAPNVAALDLITLEWEALGVDGIDDTDAEVYSLTVSRVGTVVAGGRFSHTGGSSNAYNLAVYDPEDFATGWRGLDYLLWENDATLAWANVVKFAHNGQLWVGGRFNNSSINNYFGVGGPLFTGNHSDLTNIGFINGVGGETINYQDLRMRPVESGTNSKFDNGPIDTNIPTEVFDLDIDCEGYVYMVGLFDATLRYTSVGITPTNAIRIKATSAMFAMITPQKKFIQPGISFYPLGFDSVTELPLIQINSIAYGGRCYQFSTIAPFGGGSPGSSSVPANNPGIPGAYTSSLFLGTLITDVNSPFVLFARRTIVDTGCSVESRPIIRFRGAGRLKRIVNRTTGSAIDFVPNSTLNYGEVLTIDLSSRLPRVYSNVKADAYSYLSSVNQLASFRLMRGANDIDLLYDNLNHYGEVDSNAKAWIQWRRRYESIDAVSPRAC